MERDEMAWQASGSSYRVGKAEKDINIDMSCHIMTDSLFKRRHCLVIAVCCILTTFVYILTAKHINNVSYLHSVYKPEIPIQSDPQLNPKENNRPVAYPTGKPKVKIILILAYMHTGSTFLGSILQQYPGTFYDYEPLRSLQHNSRHGGIIAYMNGTQRFPKSKTSGVNLHVATDAVTKMITCRHDIMDVSTLSRFYFSLTSSVMRDTSLYYRCIQANEHKMHRESSRVDPAEPLLVRPVIAKCLPLLTKKCENSTIRIIKFIRMRMAVAENLLNAFPDIKIIYLTRDPRAMMDSQVRKNDMGARRFDHFVYNTNDMCGKMWGDLQLFHALKNTYPNSIYPIQYEHFIQSPLKVTEKMFGFLELNFTDSIKNYVASKTVLTQSESEKHISVWRKHISIENLNVVDVNCEKVYKELGYIKLSSILDIRNVSKATFMKSVS